MNSLTLLVVIVVVSLLIVASAVGVDIIGSYISERHAVIKTRVSRRACWVIAMEIRFTPPRVIPTHRLVRH